MFLFHLRRAFEDFKDNALLHLLAASTVMLAFLLAGGFTLVYANAWRMAAGWRENVQVMVYLQDSVHRQQASAIGSALSAMPLVDRVRFVPREEALAFLRERLGSRASVLSDLPKNPLPDAFSAIIQPPAGVSAEKAVAEAALAMSRIPGVAEVEYGAAFLKTAGRFLDFSAVLGVALSALLLLAALAICANTMRLVLYNRRRELAVMELVGATESFIRAPFYIQAVLLGAISSGAALALLYGAFAGLAAGFSAGPLLPADFKPAFLPWWAVSFSILLGAATGLAGTAIALRHLARLEQS
ncbi:MAG: permease-like cell division protein FtsX [Thermodesulfobacteriota bacterium]